MSRLDEARTGAARHPVGRARWFDWIAFAGELAAAFKRAFLRTPPSRLAPGPIAPHRILFLSANPTTAFPLAAAAEERAIREELQRSPARDFFSLHVRTAARPVDLLRALREVRPTIVHFSGHGREGGLLFEGADGMPRVVSGAALARAFAATGSSVKLVVLNACYSDDQARVLRAHVDCVVGVSGAIDDTASCAFAVGLHGGLAARESIAAAFAQGCAAIALDDLPDEDQPRLLVRDGVDAGALRLLMRASDPDASGS